MPKGTNTYRETYMTDSQSDRQAGRHTEAAVKKTGRHTYRD